MGLSSIRSYSLARYNVPWEEKFNERKLGDTHITTKDVRGLAILPRESAGKFRKTPSAANRVPLRYSLFLSTHPVTVAVKPIVKAALALRPEVLSPVMA